MDWRRHALIVVPEPSGCDLPKLTIKRDLKSLDDILALTIDDFELSDYESHPAIKAELFVGLKK